LIYELYGSILKLKKPLKSGFELPKLAKAPLA